MLDFGMNWDFGRVLGFASDKGIGIKSLSSLSSEEDGEE